MKKLALLLVPSVFVTFLCVFGSVQLYSAGVHAQPVLDAGSGSALPALADIPPPPDATPAPAVNSGSGSQTKPSDGIDDPIEKPAAAFDDLKAAKKIGWAPLLFALLVMSARLLGRAGGKLAFLTKGKVSIVIGAVGAIGAAGFDTLLLGGTWISVMAAIVVALATAIPPTKPADVLKPTA